MRKEKTSKNRSKFLEGYIFNCYSCDSTRVDVEYEDYCIYCNEFEDLDIELTVLCNNPIRIGEVKDYYFFPKDKEA